MGRDLPSPSPQCLQIPKATYGGAASGEGEGGSQHPPLAGGSSSSAVPHGYPVAPQMVGRGAQGLPVAFVGAGARGAGSAGEECPRSMPTMLGLTALKSGCHIPSGQPFTSIRGGLFGSRLIQPTQTALNPLAPAGPGRGLLAPSRALGTGMCRCHPAAASEGMM